MAACAVCGDTGFELLEKDGREFARPCACRGSARGPAASFLERSRVPPRYEHCSLANFDGGNASLRAAL